MTGWRLTSSIPAMMRSLSSCFDATRMWRRTDRANLQKKPSTRLSQEPCLSVNVNSKRQQCRRGVRRTAADDTGTVGVEVVVEVTAGLTGWTRKAHAIGNAQV